MKLLEHIPGFRSKKYKNIIISTIYYIIFTGVLFGSSNIAMALLVTNFMVAPIIIFGAIDKVNKLKQGNYEFENKEIIYIGLIFYIGITLIYGANDGKVLVSKADLNEYRSLNKKIEN